MTKLKRCPLCGKEPTYNGFGWGCEGHTLFGNPAEWDERPIEDELNARIKELEEEISSRDKYMKNAGNWIGEK